MNRQDIVNELRDRGYVAEIKDVKKNGTVPVSYTHLTLPTT